MPDVVFAVPGELDTPTGGYAYARRMIELLPEQGVSVTHLKLPAGYPDPSQTELEETAGLLAGVAGDSILLIDGLAYGAMPEDLLRAVRARIVALVHHPLGLESGLSPDRSRALIASETAALALADKVIVTSRETARVLASELQVPAHRIAVAEPGTEPARRARGSGSPLQILAVGAVSPRKGYDVLVSALAHLRSLRWRATIAGATDRNPGAVAALRTAIAREQLEERITLSGAVSDAELAALFDAADLFVSPSLYEGYGMVLAEAMAHGLPIVASTGGAAAQTIPNGAALKVAPGDVAGLARALRSAISDAALRLELADASWQAGQKLPRWSDTASRIALVLKELGA